MMQCLRVAIKISVFWNWYQEVCYPWRCHPWCLDEVTTFAYHTTALNEVRLNDAMVATFGPADERSHDEDKEEDNPFPEPEVDEMRAQRDIALAQFVQEKERREALMKKMAFEGDTKEHFDEEDDAQRQVRLKPTRK